MKFYRFEFPETSATSDVFIIDPFQMQQMKKEKQVDDAGINVALNVFGSL